VFQALQDFHGQIQIVWDGWWGCLGLRWFKFGK